MNPVTFLVLIFLSLLTALGLLIFAPGVLLVHGPLLTACWTAGMVLYVGCAYLWAWLEDVAAEREQEQLRRWREEAGCTGCSRDDGFHEPDCPLLYR